jgi:hypothetical protein
MSENRINYQPDYIFSIVRIPANWKPREVYDVPPTAELVTQVAVASFDEAHDDLVRCNGLALISGWREWAIIQTADTQA